MDQDVIIQIIKRAENDAYFVGKASGTKIEEIEYSLGVKLPESYKWFLENFGHGGVSGVEILGNGLGEEPICVKVTKNWRKHGLPAFMVCPVVDWEQNIGTGKKFYNNFYEFMKARIEESLNT